MKVAIYSRIIEEAEAGKSSSCWMNSTVAIFTCHIPSVFERISRSSAFP